MAWGPEIDLGPAGRVRLFENVEEDPGLLQRLGQAFAPPTAGPMVNINGEDIQLFAEESLDKLQGTAEVPMTVASGAAADAVGGWNAMIKGGYAGDTVDKTRENMTFQPRSEGARSAFEGLGRAMEGPMNWMLEKRDVAEGAANKTIGTMPAALLYSTAAGLLAAWPGSRGGSNALRQGSKQMMRGGNKPPTDLGSRRADELLKDFDSINESLTQSEKIMRDVAGDDWHKLSIQDYRDRAIQRAFREKYPDGEKFADTMVKVRAQYEAGHERLGKIDEVYNKLKYPPENLKYNEPLVDIPDSGEYSIPGNTFRPQDRGNYNPKASSRDQQLVVIDADALDELWSARPDNYVHADRGNLKSPNVIGNRIENARKYMMENHDVDVGEAWFDPERGYIAFHDGRHRAAVMLDANMKKIPVSMDRENAQALKKYLEQRQMEGANVTPIGPGRKQRGSLGDTEKSPEVNKLAATTAGKAGATPEVTEVKVPKMTAREFQGTVAGPKSLQTFNQRLSEARQGMSAQGKAQVDKLVPEGFTGNLYMNAEQTAGFALSKDGYVSHLWKGGDSVRDAMGAALTKARAAGAKNLDAFDTFLAQKYMERGAVEKSRGPFDPSRLDPEDANALRGTGPGGSDPSMVSMDIGGVFPEYKHSQILGPREQTPLERYVPARGEPKTITESFKGGKVGRLNRIVEEGIRQEGHKWYWLAGMLDDFIDNLGPKLGVQRFDTFMDQNAGVSPRSAVDMQIKRASVLYQRMVKGESISDLKQPPGTMANPKGETPHFPEGYGHLANDIHMSNMQRLEETGSIGTGVDRPKVSSYAENPKGNYEPLTGDSHNYLIVTGRKGSPSAAEYPFLESRQGELALRKDLQPAEWQSALWVGGGDITGVRDTRNLTAQMNRRIAATAEVLNIPEAEAKLRFMMGDTRLYQLMGAAIGAGLLMEGEEATDSNALNDL